MDEKEEEEAILCSAARQRWILMFGLLQNKCCRPTSIRHTLQTGADKLTPVIAGETKARWRWLLAEDGSGAIFLVVRGIVTIPILTRLLRDQCDDADDDDATGGCSVEDSLSYCVEEYFKLLLLTGPETVFVYSVIRRIRDRRCAILADADS